MLNKAWPTPPPACSEEEDPWQTFTRILREWLLGRPAGGQPEDRYRWPHSREGDALFIGKIPMLSFLVERASPKATTNP